ncbi:aminodeoxychorismate/anthranilate synthase component II [Gordonia sp. HNM0687]|uniref:Aminodeoxychorismate/anthranilate synthase component II n=1 Tax=Gordonia mangrovi TaxID=2665643 RepID=A0A6L7GPT4_9ACTN|nr:aminodeoxychorismate/anthranilate synthase component II [Gordonia mangrovi]MXP21367.1 aminodeoxychorismate/anthranilate synthase component II [Gordonia mangrovi]UVF80117.1 aminodeoxychorismate/anthranilate synthase component II [Gordonia mangrovi]
MNQPPVHEGSGSAAGRILVIDNYDSFVYNLVQYLGQLGVEAVVWRNDDPQLADPAAAVEGFDGVLLSPGPGTPQRAGATIPMVGVARQSGLPLLGVCLGHQAIGAAFGGTVDRAPELLHGKTSQVIHEDVGVLAGLPSPFTATRYHSLTVVPDTIPDELIVTGRTESGIVMAMAHRELPIHGVQFHPESVLTQGGHRMLANWLGICGIHIPESRVAVLESEMAAAVG